MSIDSIRGIQSVYTSNSVQAKPDVKIREEAVHVQPVHENTAINIEDITGKDPQRENGNEQTRILR